MPDPSAANTIGLSRAAKKRAKKKHRSTVSVRDTTVSTSSKPQPSLTSMEPNKRSLLPEIAAPTTATKIKKPRMQNHDSASLHNDTQQPDPSSLDVGSASYETTLPMLPSCEFLKELLLLDEESVDSPFNDLTAQERAQAVLNFCFAPSHVTTAEFYHTYWETKPLCVQSTGKRHRHRFDGFLSKKLIQDMTSQHTMYYGRDLNVTRYETQQDGVKRRVTLDIVHVNEATETSDAVEDNFVVVNHDELWSRFDQGCTIRLLCPHKHSDSTHGLLSLLESEWTCMVGANAYLTPPSGSQGFAPHYDDIEAFCLQLEGKKRWKVYAPLQKSERLPRTSSEDYVEADLRDVEPALDVVLKPGDVLYMPRGWIHQACTIDGTDGYSLHLTVSAMQQWAWADLMELLLPEALQSAASGDSTMLRQGLPRGFLNYMGAMYDQKDTAEILEQKAEQDRTAAMDETGGDGEDESGETIDHDHIKRQEILVQNEKFRQEAKKKIMKVAKEAIDMLDAACDQIGKRFLSDRVPPVLTHLERSLTVHESDAKVLPQTLCRMARPGSGRLVLEAGKAVLYHCADNSRVYHELPLSPMEFEMDDAPAMEQLLITTEHDWVRVADLIHDSIEDKVGVAQALYDEGILCIQTSDM